MIDLPEPWCGLLSLKSTRSRLMPCLEWKRDGGEESPNSADWLWNALLRLVWFKFCLQMVVLFDKVGIFQTMTSLEEMGCWEQTLEFIATYNADTKALLLICQAVRNFCCKLKAAFTESHLPSFHTMMDCFPKIGN